MFQIVGDMRNIRDLSMVYNFRALEALLDLSYGDDNYNLKIHNIDTGQLLNYLGMSNNN